MLPCLHSMASPARGHGSHAAMTCCVCHPQKGACFVQCFQSPSRCLTCHHAPGACCVVAADMAECNPQSSSNGEYYLPDFARCALTYVVNGFAPSNSWCCLVSATCAAGASLHSAPSPDVASSQSLGATPASPHVGSCRPGGELAAAQGTGAAQPLGPTCTASCHTVWACSVSFVRCNPRWG
jgi:hypothetical protein